MNTKNAQTAIGVSLAAIAAYFLFRPTTASADVNAYVPDEPFTTFTPKLDWGILTPSYPTYSDPLEDLSMPRGIRNHNPMNLRYYAPINWDGQIGPDDSGYARFETPEMGIRAGVKNLMNGYFKKGINSPRNIIMKYAPAHENPTDSYTQFIANWMGVDVLEPIDPTRSNMIKLAKGIIQFENGVQPYLDSTIMRGVDMGMA